MFQVVQCDLLKNMVEMREELLLMLFHRETQGGHTPNCFKSSLFILVCGGEDDEAQPMLQI